MDTIWIIAGFAGFLIALVVVYALMKMASDTDRAVRHAEKMLNPLSDVFVTQADQNFR
jgi:hypothetical protein